MHWHVEYLGALPIQTLKTKLIIGLLERGWTAILSLASASGNAV